MKNQLLKISKLLKKLILLKKSLILINGKAQYREDQVLKKS